MFKPVAPLRPVFLAIACALVCQAHVGSPDIYLDGAAGPYHLFVTIRPPTVIPGVAELEIRSQTPGIQKLRAVPLPMAGPGAQFAPIPDQLSVSPQDPQLFTGSLWMMAPGSWQVRITADGAKGSGSLAVPVPSAALRTKTMQHGLGALLLLLGTFLVAGVVAMAGASVREARLAPGLAPDVGARNRGRIAMGVALFVVLGVVWLGNAWWNSEATSYSAQVYKPIQMKASLDPSGTLVLNLTDPGWLRPQPGRISFFSRSVDDLAPDHNHLMHLYAIRQPGLDVVYHLHPVLADPGVFHLALPAMPPGKYDLYADIVHANGFPETLVASVNVPRLPGRPLIGDDATGSARPWPQASTSATSFLLPDGYHFVWDRPAGPLRARTPTEFRFRLLDPAGQPPRDMAFYMGMLGHAAFVKTDGTVFAHIHPSGSVSMAALMLAQNHADPPATDGMKPARSAMKMDAMDMPGMDMSAMSHHDDSAASAPATLPNVVSFPYGFPTPGRYRIFIQMKHGSTVETGVFDAQVE